MTMSVLVHFKEFWLQFFSLLISHFGKKIFQNVNLLPAHLKSQNRLLCLLNAGGITSLQPVFVLANSVTVLKLG
jgi:hypothetical protein